MTSIDFIALLPLLITAYTGTVLTVIIAFWRSHNAAYTITLAGFAAAFGSIFAALLYAPRNVTPLIRIDTFSLYFDGLILVGSFLVVLFCRDYLRGKEKSCEAFYPLSMFAVLGMMAVVSGRHFITFFLGYEILSASLYGLIGYTRGFKESLEAAIKYLILSAVSSAFLLFGIALLYTEFGTMDFHRLALLIAGSSLSVLSTFGLALVIVGFGFKLAIVPFHMWSPDVYQGAPAPISALIASGSKGAVFALFLRLVATQGLNTHKATFLILAVLAVATMSVGNLLALLQNNIKRLLAYSSIAQIGYLMIPLLAGGTRGASSIAFYLVFYVFAIVLAFGVIAVLSRERETGDMETLEDYHGLISVRPALAYALTLSLLALVGMPVTVGFFGKFYIFSAAAASGLWWLLIIGLVNSGISAYYYLRVVFIIFAQPEMNAENIERLPTPGPASSIALVVMSAALITFGIYPALLFRLAETAVKMIDFR